MVMVIIVVDHWVHYTICYVARHHLFVCMKMLFWKKDISYYQLWKKSQKNDADEPDDATNLVGKPYGLIMMENGNHKFVHHM